MRSTSFPRPNVMPSIEPSDETAKAFTPDRWLRSGDLASVKHGGYIFIGRTKDMIVSSGGNVYRPRSQPHSPPIRLLEVRGLQRAPRRTRGSKQCVPKLSSDTLSTSPRTKLAARCRQSIGRFKVPRSIALRSEPLPKSGAGNDPRARRVATEKCLSLHGREDSAEAAGRQVGAQRPRPTLAARLVPLSSDSINALGDAEHPRSDTPDT